MGFLYCVIVLLSIILVQDNCLVPYGQWNPTPRMYVAIVGPFEQKRIQPYVEDELQLYCDAVTLVVQSPVIAAGWKGIEIKSLEWMEEHCLYFIFTCYQPEYKGWIAELNKKQKHITDWTLSTCNQWSLPDTMKQQALSLYSMWGLVSSAGR